MSNQGPVTPEWLTSIGAADGSRFYLPRGIRLTVFSGGVSALLEQDDFPMPKNITIELDGTRRRVLALLEGLGIEVNSNGL